MYLYDINATECLNLPIYLYNIDAVYVTAVLTNLDYLSIYASIYMLPAGTMCSLHAPLCLYHIKIRYIRLGDSESFSK